MKNIKRYYTLNAEPEDVFNALTNKTMIEIWTGEAAEMEPIAGSEFSLWEVAFLELILKLLRIKNCAKMVFGEDEEESIVTLKIHPHKKGTSVELNHTNIPEEAFENISEGWDEDYFGSINELFL